MIEAIAQWYRIPMGVYAWPIFVYQNMTKPLLEELKERQRREKERKQQEELERQQEFDQDDSAYQEYRDHQIDQFASAGFGR